MQAECYLDVSVRFCELLTWTLLNVWKDSLLQYLFNNIRPDVQVVLLAKRDH